MMKSNKSIFIAIQLDQIFCRQRKRKDVIFIIISISNDYSFSNICNSRIVANYMTQKVDLIDSN